MSVIAAKKELENYTNNLANLLGEFYSVIDLFTENGENNTPDAPVYEFQHAIVHLSHVFGEENPEIQLKQYTHACAHLERGILDAWKVLVFNQKILKSQSSAFFKDILNARLTEYKEIKNKTIVNDIPNSRKKYKTLYCKYIKLEETPNFQIIKSKARGDIKDFLNSLFEWTKFELVLSSLLGYKNLDILKDLLLILKNDGDASSIRKLTGEIAFNIMEQFDKLNLIDTLNNKEQRHVATQKAQGIYNSSKDDDKTCFIKLCEEFYLNPFCNFSSK